MKTTVAIVGSGPAALMLAVQLDETKFSVTIYEKNFAPARKFLVAGDGGFNLTHSESIDQFIERYIPSSFFQKMLTSFSNSDLRAWLKSVGIDTYVGSSERVFPLRGIKPIDVLNAILERIENKKVKLLTQHEWQGWNEREELVFKTKEGELNIKAGVTVFALGGASWSKTGSDGKWINYFREKSIALVPFQPSNCAFQIKWPASFLKEAEAEPLKNISIQSCGKEKAGEVMITDFGIEGGAVYALSSLIRKQLNETGRAQIFIDLKPSLSIREMESKISAGKAIKSWTKHLSDQLRLGKTEILLLKTYTGKEEFMDPKLLVQKIKALPLTITGMAPVDEAISTIGGVSLDAIDENFQLKKMPGYYVIGEMLDWDAPTGGYLLQACFSMGFQLARYLNLKTG